MRHKFIHIICITLLVTGITACTPGNKNTAEKRYTFNNILDIAYTPDTLHRCYGWFTDAGLVDGLHSSRERELGKRFLRPIQSGYVPPPVDGSIRCYGRF